MKLYCVEQSKTSNFYEKIWWKNSTIFKALSRCVKFPNKLKNVFPYTLEELVLSVQHKPNKKSSCFIFSDKIEKLILHVILKAIEHRGQSRRIKLKDFKAYYKANNRE